MSQSLKVRVKKLCYKGLISEKDRDRILEGLKYVNGTDIRSEIASLIAKSDISEYNLPNLAVNYVSCKVCPEGVVCSKKHNLNVFDCRQAWSDYITIRIKEEKESGKS